MRLADLAQGLEDRNLPTARVPLRDSIDTARGYRMIDEEWTCIPDSMYPWDADCLRQIREFAPDTVPLWRLSVFFEPNTRNVVVFGRHALGRCIERPGYELSPFRCSMPTMPCQGVHFGRPNKVWFVHEGERNRDYPDIPGQYLPFDSGLVAKAKWSVGSLPSMSEKEAREFLRQELIESKKLAQEKRRAELADDWQQRQKEWERYSRRQFDNISEVEIDEYLRSVGKRSSGPKPMVQVGDYPRGE